MKRGESGGELRKNGVERRRSEGFAGLKALFERSTGENRDDDATAARLRRGKKAGTNRVDCRKKTRRGERAEEAVAFDGGGADVRAARAGGRRFKDKIRRELGTAGTSEIKGKFGVGTKATRRFPTRKTEIDVGVYAARKLRDVVGQSHKGAYSNKEKEEKEERRAPLLRELSDVDALNLV